MTPDGDEVVVTGDELTPSHYPKRELLPALVACGERYAAYLRKLRGGDPDWAARLMADVGGVVLPPLNVVLGSLSAP